MWGCGLAVVQSCQIYLGDIGLQKQVLSGKKLLQKNHHVLSLLLD